MEDFMIATASTCDLDRSWLDEHDIKMISYTFEINGTVYTDDCTKESRETLFKAMRNDQLPNTSQINYYAYYEFFMSLLQTGKPVIFADMTKAISGSYFNSVRAAEQIREEHPEYQLYIVDTRCVTFGLGMLIKGMAAEKEAGKSYEEVIQYAENTKLHIVHRFMIDQLKWLQRGGRLSNASTIVGSLLSIKPLIYIPDDGSLVAYAKVRGRKKAIRSLVDAIEKDIGDPSGKTLIVGHSDCQKDAEELAEKIKEKYPTLGNIEIIELGPVIGCHVGPDFLATVYYTEGKREQ